MNIRRKVVRWLARNEPQMKVSLTELVQVGIMREDGSRLDTNDKRDSLMIADNKQATTAKFRQVKAHLRNLRQGVNMLVDEIDRLTSKNSIKTSDLNRLREVRAEISKLIDH